MNNQFKRIKEFFIWKLQICRQICFFEEKTKLLQKYEITSDAQINGTENGQKFLAEFTPLSIEDSGVELHKIRMTFDELCDVLENYGGNLSGDIMTLQLICKDEESKEGE